MPSGPHIEITSFDVGPDDLAAQLPVTAQLLRMLPGPDRPDYALAVARTPLTFATTVDALASQGVPVDGIDPRWVQVRADGSVRATVFGLVLAPRTVGAALHPTMVDLPVALALVIDPTQMSAPAVDFSKCSYVAVALVTTVQADESSSAG